MSRPLTLSVLLLLCLSPAAFAADARVGTIAGGYKDTLPAVYYTAAPGELNRITVTIDRTPAATSIVVHDSGARIIAGEGCSAIDAQTVRCQDAAAAIVDAGDGDDTLTLPAGGLNTFGRGGPGADTLTGAGHLAGGPGNDVLMAAQQCAEPCRVVLSGGSGDDVLRGGPGDDVLSGDGDDRANPFVGDASETGPLDAVTGNDAIDGGQGTDTVRYTRPSGVRVDLADHARNGAPGELDRVTNIENAFTGDGPDVLLGDERDNELSGGSGADVVVGRAGDDVLREERPPAYQDFLPPTAPDGADTLRGGAGADMLFGGNQPGDRLFGGPGDDVLANEAVDMLARTVSCGAGADAIRGAPRRVLLADCERIRFPNVTMTVRPQLRRDGRLRLSATCQAASSLGCRLWITLRVGSARVAQRSLTIRGARLSFLMRPARPLRRGDVLDIAVSGGLVPSARTYDFGGRWRARV